MRTGRTAIRAAVALLATLLQPAPPATAAALKLRDVGPAPGLLWNDEARYLAISTVPFQQQQGPIVLLDTVTGTRAPLPAPAGCHLVDLHRGTVLWGCAGSSTVHGSSESGRTLELASGAIGTLPAPPPDPLSSWGDYGSYRAIGEHWAVTTFTTYHAAYDVYVDRATGALRMGLPGRYVVEDLDAPGLIVHLCSGQRRPYVPDTAFGIGVEPGDLARAGRWAAMTSYADDDLKPRSRVELQRCGTRPRTLQRCVRISCSDPVITSRYVAWTESRRKPKRSRLVVRSLRTGRTRTVRRTDLSGPLLVGDRLFVVANGRLARVAL